MKMLIFKKCQYQTSFGLEAFLQGIQHVEYQGFVIGLERMVLLALSPPIDKLSV